MGTNSAVLKLTKENFKQEIIDSGKLALVDFWAEWCGPCRIVSPIIEQLAKEYGDKVVIAKVNVDEEEELAVQYKIMSIPTVIFFKEGNILERSVGARSKEEYGKIINSYNSDE